MVDFLSLKYKSVLFSNGYQVSLIKVGTLLSPLHLTGKSINLGQLTCCTLICVRPKQGNPTASFPLRQAPENIAKGLV